MFVFPFIYILLFFVAIRSLFKDRMSGILIFIIFGLSMYTTVLSVSNMYGFSKWIPYLQTCKEACILSYLIYLVVNLGRKIHFHIIDKLMLFFFFYILLYVFIPLGSYGFFQR